VFTKLLDDHEGFIQDDLYELNAWDDPRVRQKPILQDLREFAQEYEADLKKYEEKQGIPSEKSSQNQVMALIE